MSIIPHLTIKMNDKSVDVSNFYNKKIGILGGGQLGKMLCVSATNLHLDISVLDPSSDCSAAFVCKKFYCGNLSDYDTVYRFGQSVDVITIEIENVNTEALMKLAEEGKVVHPAPHALHIIQDKGLQKEFYSKNNLKTSPYIICENKKEIHEQIKNGSISFPFVQKSRKAGYDGKGVVVINSSDNLHKLMETPCVIEQKVNIQKELSVIAVRDVLGNVSCYAPVEMIFDEQANLVKYLLCPAQISETIAQKAIVLATETINAFDIVGILAVEMFLDENNELLINEVAPRPHNSGHHTIENTFTSQYEQQLRAILGLPLGSVKTIMPAVMLNLLGEPGYSGAARYVGIEKCLEIEGVKIHLYGKSETKPYRKMGHVTILDSTLESAKHKAEYIFTHLKVIA